VPCPLQQNISQAFFVDCMVPLREIRVAVTILWWCFHLNVVHTSSALKPFLLVMSVTQCLFIEGEKLTKFPKAEVSLYILLLVNHTTAEGFLVSLPLENFFLYEAHSNKTIDITLLFLAIPPASCHSLLIVSWIPVWIKHHQAICSDEIQATPTSFATEHK
ncbi:hypothetical protein EGW08_009048, partial [Elysia chlorotica]